MVSGNSGTSYRQKETCGQVLMDGCEAKIDGAPVIGDVGKTEERCNDQGIVVLDFRLFLYTGKPVNKGPSREMCPL